MPLTWVCLLPMFVVIAMVLITHKLNQSLVVGILSAALIATHGQVLLAFAMCIRKLIEYFSDADNVCLYFLLVTISSLITLLTVTGSAAGAAQIVGKKIRTKRSVEISTILLSFLLSIDDYLSILTVGFVMRPIADRLAVVRTKLAYIMHALAGPLVIIMPISTWAAAVLVQMDNGGINLNAPHKIVADSFYVYLKTIPFVFYSVLVLFSVCFVVVTKIRYGAIARDEECAVVVNDVVFNNVAGELNDKHSLFELLIPIVLLVSSVFIGILYAGNYHLFGGSNSFFEAFKENDKTFLVLLVSALIAFCFSLMFSLYKRMVVVPQIPSIIMTGIEVIRDSLIMIMCASLLGSFLRHDLHTGDYLASLLLGTAPLYLIPLILFIVSLAITLMTGSAWGTFSIMIPIVTQMLISFLQLEVPVSLDQIPVLYPALGAVLSGAACGNHLSPFAETTIMTATSAGVEPLRHARTQFLYAIPVIIGSCVSFIIAGRLLNKGALYNALTATAAGLSVMVLLLIIANKMHKKAR